MFTGIIEELGRVVEFAPGSGGGAKLRIACKDVMPDVTPGASIAVNGVCLTAVDFYEDGFGADLAPETLLRSNLGDLRAGSVVNLERPVTPVTRLSGHIVQGHVDATGVVLGLALEGNSTILQVQAPADFDRYLIDKGSIAVDGISLTVVDPAGDGFSVAVIPATLSKTTLSRKRPGDAVNMEADMIGKHIFHYLKRGGSKGGITADLLAQHGFA